MENKAVSLVRELCKQPALQSASLSHVNEFSITVESVWTQRCIEKNSSHKFLRNYILNKDDFKVISQSKPLIGDESIWNITSPSGKKTAVVRTHCPDKDKPKDKKGFFEIWLDEGFCEKVVDVSLPDKHGEVYGQDGAFGSLSWNSAEDKLAYVAEKKPPKATSYFIESKSTSDEKDKPIPGTKYLFKEDWGESLVDKTQPVICILDLTSGDITVLEEDALNEASCGQVVWCPHEDGFVFCATAHQTCKLGITYCPIRQSILYHYDCENKTLRRLTASEGLSVMSPRFSPDGSRLVYLECEAGGSHMKCLKLNMINWKSRDINVVVDVVNSASADTMFQGIYIISLLDRCWNKEGTHVFFSTAVRSRKDVFMVNVSTKEISKLTKEVGCWTVEDVFGDYILVSMSTLTTPHRLAIGKLEMLDKSTDIDWVYLDRKTVISGIKWEILEHTPRIPHAQYGSLTYESIVLQPSDQECQGLIIFPHGGPHSGYTSRYAAYFAFLVKMGFTVALVNYRGSTGFGEDGIKSLLGNIGENEIADVQQCAEELLAKYNLDSEKVAVIGGSHGGFITAHLIGQYPKFYKAAVIDNGVTNLVTMISLTDIPDWGHVEAGWEPYILSKVPTAEGYAHLYSKSPVAYIDSVQTPTLVFVGQVDKRVPPSQGIEYHKALKAKGVPTKMYLFPESSHSFDTIETQTDCLVHLYLWLATHIGI